VTLRPRWLLLGCAVVSAVGFEACLYGPCHDCDFGYDSSNPYNDYDVQAADVPWLFGDTSFSDAVTTDAGEGDASTDADDSSADADDGSTDADDGGG
jgi:hypothetical protein